MTAPEPGPDAPITAWRCEVAVDDPSAIDTELLTATAWQLGATGIWDRDHDDIVIWFGPISETERTDISAALADAVPATADAHRWRAQHERDWQAEWKATIGPLQAGRFHLVPSWMVDETTTPDDQLRIIQDPGQAFGSGHHATTAMCLELLGEHTQTHDLTGVSVADVGCGTGVLAIAAALLGSKDVHAVDIDVDAVHVTASNCATNHVDVRCSVGSAAELRAGGPYAVVLANLVTDTVIELHADLAELVAPGGVMIVSGIATERHARPLQLLGEQGLQIERQLSRDTWTAATLRRPR